MKYDIRGDKLVVTNAIKEYTEEKVSKIEKYLASSDELIARIVVSVKGKDQKVEVTIPTKNLTLRAEEKNNDLYAAIDLVVEKLERQIIKNKTKMLSKNIKNKVSEFILTDIESDEDEDEVIVKRKQLDTKPMSEEEAILQMNMLGHDFFIFKDDKTFGVSVLYRRKDGDYGLIETK
ncbi:MAG: ribosome-associated translation inhibitor RaiA [Bacilli bacterium]|jgi:ribosomal subunit interface protein